MFQCHSVFMKMNFTKVFFCVLLFVTVYSEENSLPSFVKICKRYDPEASKCWKETLQALKPYLIKGIPEFKIPPFDPLFLRVLKFNQKGESSLSYGGQLENVTMSGAGNFEVEFLEVDLKKMYLNMNIYYPRVNIKARYRARGNILLFKIDSDGEIETEASEVTVNFKFTLDIIKTKDDSHLHIKSGSTNTKVNKIHIHVSNLFPNNPEITEQVNIAINENMDSLFQEFEPMLSSAQQTFIIDYMDRVFSKYTLDELLPIE